MKIEPKGKTLAELDVRPGDVVRWDGRIDYTVGAWKHEYDAWGILGAGEEHTTLIMNKQYEVVSRANEPTEDKPKTWGEMTRLEQGEILVDDHNGLPIEAFVHSDFWEEKKNGFPYFPNKSYRTRKEPVRGTTVRYGRARDFLGFEPDARDNCKLHFPTLDGELIHGTYTNEAGDVIVMETIGDE